MTPSNPMPDQAPSRAAYNSLVEAARGPIMLVTLGLLLAADQTDRIGIDRTWPALLILYGLMKLASYVGGRQA
ncbi:MAG: hypothetical protein ABI811_21010 [Acidobacteriota bacterium]